MMDSYTFQQKDDPILKVFALLFVPIMSYQCWIFQELPNYYLQHLLFYPCLLLFFWSFYKKYFNIIEAWRIVAPFLPWLAAIVAIYTFISWRSASLHPLENQSVVYGTALSVIQFLIQIPFLFFFAFIIKILLSNLKLYKYLLYGLAFSFTFIVAISIIQFAYSLLSFSGFGVDSQFFILWQKLLNWIGSNLESHWQGGVYDFYSKGSYTTTLKRTNGIYEEASTLATWAGIFFLPIFSALYFLGGKYKKLFLYGILGSFLLMFVSVSVTGFLLISAACVYYLLVFLYNRQKKGLALVVFILWALAGIMVFAYVHENKIKIARTVITLATLEQIKENPLGVGKNWFSTYITSSHVGKKEYRRDIDPEIRIWFKKKEVPRLSILAALVLEYGFIIFAIALYLVFRIWKKMELAYKANPEDPLLKFSHTLFPMWIFMSLAAATTSYDLRSPYFCFPLFIVFAAPLVIQKESND